jgi:hypothetical protein
MNIIHNKSRGIIFSFDIIITFLIILFGITVFVFALHNNTNSFVKNVDDFFLEEKTIFVADSFVKNFDPTNALLGSCVIDLEKRRVKSNELASANFSNLKSLGIESFFVKRVSYRVLGNTSEQIIYSSARQSLNCLTAKRFVLIDAQKALVFVTGCLDE